MHIEINFERNWYYVCVQLSLLVRRNVVRAISKIYTAPRGFIWIFFLFSIIFRFHIDLLSFVRVKNGVFPYLQRVDYFILLSMCFVKALCFFLPSAHFRRFRGFPKSDCKRKPQKAIYVGSYIFFLCPFVNYVKIVTNEKRSQLLAIYSLHENLMYA